MALYTVHLQPDDLRDPVLVVQMEGWIDAGTAGNGAMNALLNTLDTTLLASFHVDYLLDQRARRPFLQVSDGVNSGLSWPKIELLWARDHEGRDILLLSGPEPDYQWRGFARDAVALGQELGVKRMFGLGAFPSPVPHTRPTPLVCTASTAEVAQDIGFMPGTFEVPAGIQAVLERGFAGADTPAVGLWARVPHYVAAMPYPAASLTLLEALARLAPLDLDLTELRRAAVEARERLDVLVAADPRFPELVERLEAQADAESETDGGMGFGNLPTGDELAAELERFLRDQD
ncbi:MAG: proteasome assembly chaperone family protein [Acidimicrobiales bacterium]